MDMLHNLVNHELSAISAGLRVCVDVMDAGAEW
jgi:hypothetical protein